MNTLKIITLILIVVIVTVLAGCSESMRVEPETQISSPGGERHGIVTPAQLQSPWWESGYIDSNWPY